MKKLFTMFAVLAVCIVMAVPMAMAKFEVGGVLFVDAYYISRDKKNAADMGLGDGTTSYGATTIQLPNISRFYGRWTNEDNVGMYIEMGIGQAYGEVEWGSSDMVELRHAYGWWDILPEFQIMAGKSTTPFSPLNPSQLLGTRSGNFNIIGAGYGDFYSGRIPQVRATYKFNDSIKLTLALVDPNGTADEVGDFGPWGWWENYQTSTKIPRIDIALPISFGGVKIYPSFLYQRRTVDTSPYDWSNDDYLTMSDKSLDTYVGSLGIKAGFGALSIEAEGNYGKNAGNTKMLLGYSYPAIFSNAGISEDGTKIHDATTYGYWIDIAYKFGPVTPHLIYGEMKSETSYFGIDFDANSRMYGVSVPIELAKGFTIRPELMWYDEGKVELQEMNFSEDYDPGKYMIAGVQFQITF